MAFFNDLEQSKAGCKTALDKYISECHTSTKMDKIGRFFDFQGPSDKNLAESLLREIMAQQNVWGIIQKLKDPRYQQATLIAPTLQACVLAVVRVEALHISYVARKISFAMQGNEKAGTDLITRKYYESLAKEEIYKRITGANNQRDAEKYLVYIYSGGPRNRYENKDDDAFGMELKSFTPGVN